VTDPEGPLVGPDDAASTPVPPPPTLPDSNDPPGVPGGSAEIGRVGGSTGGWRGRALSLVLVVLVAVFLGVALVRNWQAVRADLQALSWIDLLASGVAGALAVTCSGLGWRVVLTGLGERVPVHPALTIFFAGQLGKYVPGSVWTAAIQADLGRRRAIAGATMLVSYMVALMIAVATGGVVGLLVLFGAGAPRAVALWMLLLAAIVGAALLRPGWMNRGLAWAFARAGRTPPPVELPPRALAACVAWLIACWLLFGLHAWLLARPLGAGTADLAPTIGAFALAFVAGLLVVPLPAGAGVREGVLVATLAGSIGAPAALTVSLVSRLVLLGVDVVMAGLFGVGRAARAVRSGGGRPATD
jgi:glycosyltransferase 2 family protein